MVKIQDLLYNKNSNIGRLKKIFLMLVTKKMVYYVEIVKKQNSIW